MTYNGRRGPNVSEYIAQLNSIPTAQDIQNSDNFQLDDDLAMFTNTQFFDFDLGQDADLQPSNFDGRAEQTVAPESIDMKPMDFSIRGTFCHIISFHIIPHSALHILWQSALVLHAPSASSIDVAIAALPFDQQTTPQHGVFRCKVHFEEHWIVAFPHPKQPSGPITIHTGIASSMLCIRFCISVRRVQT